jgi:predicted RND superfamily exporter protein
VSAYRRLLGRGGPPLLLGFLIAAAAAAAFLPRFQTEASTHVLLNENDPDLAFYNLTRAEWETDEYLIVLARRADWFTPEGVAELKAFSGALAAAPHVAKVVSILSVPLLRNRPNPFGLPVPVPLDDPKIDLEKARAELMEHTQVLGNLISADGRDAALLVYLDLPPSIRDLEPRWARAHGRGDRAGIEALRAPYLASLDETRRRRTEMMAAVRRLARDAETRLEEPVRLSGIPAINVNLVEHVDEDLRTFGLLSLVLFTLAFAAVYRRGRWTLLPILACLLPVLLVVGTMAAAGKRVTVITSNLPVLLFVLMLPYTVYFIERLRERRRQRPDEGPVDAAAGAAGDVWMPCLFSATTTMAGFASLGTSGIQPVRTFGLMMCAGIGLGLACVFLFLPAATARLAPEAAPAGPETAGSASGIVAFLGRRVLAGPRRIAAGGLLLLALGAAGSSRLKVETKFIDYFWPSSEVYQGLETIDRRLGGTTPMEIVLTSKTPGYFKTPEGLAAVEAAAAALDPARVPAAGNVRSLKTLLDEIRKSPATRTLGVEPLSRLKAAEPLVREFVNADFSVSRVLARFRETDPALHRNEILRKLRADLAARPELADVEVRPTGVFLLYANMLNSLVRSQRDTFGFELLSIFAMLALLFRSMKTALVVIVPQTLPVFVCLGTMGFTGVPLDLVTVMIASIAMGVGIDSAIQYTVRFRAELAAAGGDVPTAVRRAHGSIGRAIWIATWIVVAGFAVLSFSRFVPSVYLGLFTALAMLMGQAASLTLLPSLFVLGGGRAAAPVPTEEGPRPPLPGGSGDSSRG